MIRRRNSTGRKIQSRKGMGSEDLMAAYGSKRHGDWKKPVCSARMSTSEGGREGEQRKGNWTVLN
jgi:hypothetical protein